MRGKPGKIHRRAEMVRVANRDRADPVRLRPLHRIMHRRCGRHLSDTVAPVNNSDSTRIRHRGRFCRDIDAADLSPCNIPRQTHDAVGLMAPEIGLDQTIGGQTRTFICNSRPFAELLR